MTYFSENPYDAWDLKEALAQYMNGRQFQVARDCMKKDLEAITRSNNYTAKMKAAAQNLLTDWNVGIIYLLKNP